MKVLVTGSNGMVGTSLVRRLLAIKDKKDKTRENLIIDEVYCYDLGDEDKLDEYASKCDFIFNLAGVNRTTNKDEFYEGNFGFTSKLLKSLIRHNNKAPIMLSSSIQATLIGRYNNDYGKSKLEGEKYLRQYSKDYNVPVHIYRFNNIMGHSKPNYNSFISTLCYDIANDLPYYINDRSTIIDYIYIDDLVECMLDLLEGKEKKCVYDGIDALESKKGEYSLAYPTSFVALGAIEELLLEFKNQPISLLMPSMENDSFAKKLYSLYLSYLPKDKFKYALKMNIDDRGSFTELVHTSSNGQVSINIAKPGITKGNHYHNSKWEQFIVVSGHGLIVERNMTTNEIVEFEVSGDKIEAIYMIPGWTHSITNLSDTENLVTVMICNETYNKDKPDTYFEMVK